MIATDCSEEQWKEVRQCLADCYGKLNITPKRVRQSIHELEMTNKRLHEKAAHGGQTKSSRMNKPAMRCSHCKSPEREQVYSNPFVQEFNIASPVPYLGAKGPRGEELIAGFSSGPSSASGAQRGPQFGPELPFQQRQQEQVVPPAPVNAQFQQRLQQEEAEQQIQAQLSRDAEMHSENRSSARSSFRTTLH